MAQPHDQGDRRVASVGRWVRSHLAIAGGAAALVVVAVIVVIALALGGSGGGGTPVTQGAIVGSGPLTSGYRITGKVVKATASSITVDITSLDFSAGEARNVVLRPGAQIEFDKPADGTVALARNRREIATPAAIHKGDSVVVVGQFTSVVAPPGPVHQGYSYIGVEASSK